MVKLLIIYHQFSNISYTIEVSVTFPSGSFKWSLRKQRFPFPLKTKKTLYFLTMELKQEKFGDKPTTININDCLKHSLENIPVQFNGISVFERILYVILTVLNVTRITTALIQNSFYLRANIIKSEKSYQSIKITLNRNFICLYNFLD